MKQTIKERITETLATNNNIAEEILMIRLYEEYEKYLNYNDKVQNISLATYKNSYNRINSKMKKLPKKIGYYDNVEIIDAIAKNKAFLDYLMSNFEIANKKRLKVTEETITILESYLKLPITFPNNLEECIEEVLNKTKQKEPKRVMLK